MGLKVGPVGRVATLSMQARNTTLKTSDISQVSEFYRECYGYDSEGHKVLQSVRKPSITLEA